MEKLTGGIQEQAVTFVPPRRRPPSSPPLPPAACESVDLQSGIWWESGASLAGERKDRISNW